MVRLTKEEVLKALEEGRVTYSIRRNGRWEGPFRIPGAKRVLTGKKQQTITAQKADEHIRDA